MTRAASAASDLHCVNWDIREILLHFLGMRPPGVLSGPGHRLVGFSDL
jgi:hypothetical protein